MLGVAAGREACRTAGFVGALPVQVGRLALPRGGEYEPASVWSPYRVSVGAGVRRQPGKHIARPLVDPDVISPFSDLQCEAAAIRSEPQIPPVGGSGAQRRCLAVTIEPLNVDPLCRALASEIDKGASVRYFELRHAGVGVGHHASNDGSR